MDVSEVEPTLQKLRSELETKSARLDKAEKEVAQLQAEQRRLRAAVTALEHLVSPPPDAESEGLALTDVILATVRANPNHTRATLAAQVIKLAQSKSPDPLRVANVRIAQLIKEEKLREINTRLRIGPNVGG